MEHKGNCTSRWVFLYMCRLLYTGYTVMYTRWLWDKCSLSPGEFHLGTHMPPQRCTAPTSTVSSQIADSGHKKRGALPPQAPAINSLNRVDEWARIKNGTAQSLCNFSLQAQNKIKHLIGSDNLKHLQDWRINLFSCRNPPDSLTSYLAPSVEPQPYRSAAERLLFWTAVQRDCGFMKQSLPAENLHGKTLHKPHTS